VPFRETNVMMVVIDSTEDVPFVKTNMMMSCDDSTEGRAFREKQHDDEL
jgi:hypothetical protein